MYSYEDAIAVITTGKHKFYSNGFDLEKMERMSDSEKVDFFNDTQKLLARLLTFPMLTVAAINGMVPSNLSLSLSLSPPPPSQTPWAFWHATSIIVILKAGNRPGKRLPLDRMQCIY